jgi:acetolactate synthase II small subunit
MMQHQVALQARFNPETLERVLRVVRHRGFQICAMNMETAADARNKYRIDRCQPAARRITV